MEIQTSEERTMLQNLQFPEVLVDPCEEDPEMEDAWDNHGELPIFEDGEQ